MCAAAMLPRADAVAVRMDDAEVMLLAQVAEYRRASSMGFRNWKPPLADADVIGAAGEWAVARWLNVCPHFGAYGPDNPDAVFRGYRLDVKSSTRMDAGLAVYAGRDWTSTARVDVDVYVLVVGGLRSMHIVGWAYRAELIRPSRWTDLGYGGTYYIPQAELHPPKRLQELGVCR